MLDLGIKSIREVNAYRTRVLFTVPDTVVMMTITPKGHVLDLRANPVDLTDCDPELLKVKDCHAWQIKHLHACFPYQKHPKADAIALANEGTRAIAIGDAVDRIIKEQVFDLK